LVACVRERKRESVRVCVCVCKGYGVNVQRRGCIHATISSVRNRDRQREIERDREREHENKQLAPHHTRRVGELEKVGESS
jgi:hypothetical protein